MRQHNPYGGTLLGHNTYPYAISRMLHYACFGNRLSNPVDHQNRMRNIDRIIHPYRIVP